jgi:hypothetical protein
LLFLKPSNKISKQLSDQLSHVFRGVIADIIAIQLQRSAFLPHQIILFQPPQEPTQPK